MTVTMLVKLWNYCNTVQNCIHIWQIKAKVYSRQCISSWGCFCTLALHKVLLFSIYYLTMLIVQMVKEWHNPDKVRYCGILS